jgi:chromate transporter
MNQAEQVQDDGELHGSVLEVFWVALRLGLTSFGGPVAHIGYFREEYVNRRKWLDENAFVDLVALCQFLPGPASSQVGIAVGITRRGLLGGLAAWLGFTMPSAIALVAFAYGVASFDIAEAGWLHGLKIVAVAVVAWALWGMARTLCPDRPRATLAIVAAIVMLVASSTGAQIAVIVAGGLAGWRLLPSGEATSEDERRSLVGRKVAVGALVAFAVLLVGLPIARQVVESQELAVFDSFYRSGSLVFGGGHVVLPLLQAEVVPPGWVPNDTFTAGYGAAQAVPGPLFTFAAYLGAVMDDTSNRWAYGLLTLGAIFLPSFFLVAAVLPFWERLRAIAPFRRALMGVNATVVGLLLAALYDPVWVSAIFRPADLGLALGAFGLLAFWKVPPWVVVLLGAGGGAVLAQF